MIDAMIINDTTFASHLDRALKAQGMKKKERTARLGYALAVPIVDRDAILDREEALARDIKKARKPIIPSEHEEQSNFVNWFRHQYPDVLIFAVPNGGSRNQVEAHKLVVEGVVAGVADLCIPAWLCWIEFKRIKGSVWTPEQQVFKRYVESIGHRYILAYGCEDGKIKILVK
jgi:hypothetical protein